MGASEPYRYLLLATTAEIIISTRYIREILVETRAPLTKEGASQM